MSKRLIIIVFFSLMVCNISGQISQLGVPIIKNYNRADYNGGSQTWDILQCKNGMMYYANNDGLLEFDGTNWNNYKLPNGSILRSIEQGNDNRIYAGGYDELGYFETSDMGVVSYTSLIDLIPSKYNDFGDVWKIYRHPDGVVFQTYYYLFIFRNNDFLTIEAPSLFHFSFMVDGEYYVNDMEQGLMRYAMGNLFPQKGMESLIGKEIWSVFNFKGKLAVVTASEGIYLYDGNSLKSYNSVTNELLKANQVYCTFHLPDGRIAFGTIQNGLLITDDNLSPLNFINKNDGLQNNTILCMNTDFLGNLWLGTDHGIDYLEINLPLTIISGNYNLSTGYAALIDENMVYFGTNQGLFYINQESVFGTGNDIISLIESTSGQVWSLQKIDNTIFCGHHNGAFQINKDQARKLCNVPGVWIYRQVPDQPDKIIGGTYTGLIVFEKSGDVWNYSGEVPGFNQSSRKMEFDNDGTLWVNHGYKGLYHLFFNPGYDSVIKVDFYENMGSKLKGTSSNLAKVNEKVVFTSSRGLLNYSRSQDEFVVAEEYNTLLDSINVQALHQDINNNLWYFDESGAGVLRLGEDGNYTNIRRPFKKLNGDFVSAFEFVYPFDDNNVIFGIEEGFVHYNPRIQKDYTYNFNAFIISMSVGIYDSIYLYSDLINSEVSIDFDDNSVEFIFSSNDFENSEQMLYSTFLFGNDKEWSGWEARNTRTYTNLYEGDYTFKVKAKNLYGTISDTVEVSFKVEPPYYRSVAAFVFYGLLILLFIGIIMLLMRRRFLKARRKSEEKQKELFKKKEEEHQRESLEAEKEIIRMRNEKLREGIKLKDKELANATMQMLQKNEMLITLRDELKMLSSIIESETQKHDIIRLVRGINKEIDNEKQWKVFETHFESVHEEFLNRIIQAYPNLTPRELKLCAYLRMNISSKEISVLMNISTRGVEISRYRLRKKLGILRETNLTEFILSF